MTSLPIYLSKMVLFVSNFTFLTKKRKKEMFSLEDDTKLWRRETLDATRNLKQLKNAEKLWT
jgi:hypothetical protein